MAWGKRQKLASRALVEGDLDVATEHIRQDRFQQTLNGRRLSRRLTAALLQRAEGATAVGNLALAWKDLTAATKFAPATDEDHVSRQLNQLVELTIEAADSLLALAKTTHAVQMIDQLSRRQIMDWRADRICNVAQCLQAADDLSALGKFSEAIEKLEQAKNLQPNLPFIESRLAAGRQREIQMNELTAELQSTALKCRWADVNKCCQKILTIAPKHQIALDAQRHCAAQMKRKTSAGIRATNVPDRARISPSNSFFHVGVPSASAERETVSRISTDTVSNSGSMGTFLLWVDGVGGYLVCTDGVNTIGQASPDASISIPIVGDLRRRHARLETVAGQHLLHPLGGVTIAGMTIQRPVEIKDQQIIALEGGVNLRYTQSHPLSRTARLDCVSRHRTQPWSDAILLASQSIILGPNRNNHVFCPTWKSDLIIFRRDEKWFCRTNEPIEIDNYLVGQEGQIQFDSRIVGEDLSLTLETVP
jgi:tetratricopeptide (TPR) repeat protein